MGVGYAFSGWLPSGLKESLTPWHVVPIAQGICYAAGAMLLVYSGFRRWLLVYTPSLPPPKDRPSAIKGPMAFTDEDGELFWKLGREKVVSL